jgi:hypothetical protein
MKSWMWVLGFKIVIHAKGLLIGLETKHMRLSIKTV